MSADLQKLFKLKEQAYRAYQVLQMVNVIGMTPQQRIDLDIAVESAGQNWFSACTNYNRAVEETVKKGNRK